MRTLAIIVSFCSLSFAQLTGPLPDFGADMDYFCYYGVFGPTEVYQAQYFDLFILEPNRITAQQVADIRNGFDDILGTDDDVMVFAYVSVGETYFDEEVGDGTGPVYFNGSDTIYQHAGYASYFLDDYDQNAEPDMNGIWNSYYVNAGDPAWWAFNEARLDESLYDKGCDGLFLDTIGMPVPASWGGSYSWTAGGMAQYVAYLRSNYPDKYLFANNPSFYLHPSLPAYPYRDIIRNSINAYMYESYYLTWDWEQSIGYVSPWFEGARDTWAPLINAEAAKPDGFTCVALDYVSVDQADYATLLANQIQFTEVDLGWMTAVSSIWLNEIRFDTYHNHPVDNNSPSWPGMPGILYFEVQDSEITLFWDAAMDQTEPLSYELYFDLEPPGFDNPSAFTRVVPTSSEYFDWEYTLSDLTQESIYYACLRAVDGTPQAYTDQNRRVMEISTADNPSMALSVDGFFSDWANIENLDGQGTSSENIGDAPVPACDISDVWVASSSSDLYFSCNFNDVPDMNQYFYHVMLDVDESTSTGFHYAGSALGADFMVENTSLWRYTGVDNNWSWEYVTAISTELGLVEGNRFEMSIPLSHLNLANSTVSFYFNVNDAADLGDDDFAPDDYTVSSYSHSLTPSGTEKIELPESELVVAYPNPFNAGVTFIIPSYLESDGDMRFQIFDLKGRMVQDIFVKAPNNGRLTWDGLDLSHRNIESGVYIYRLTNKTVGNNQIVSSGKLLSVK